MTSLSSIRHLIIDMDGVLWHGETALPSLVEFFAFLRRRSIRFVLATNNASQTPRDGLAQCGYGLQGRGAGDALAALRERQPS